MIKELLFYGAGNARTGKELAEQLQIDIRTVTTIIESERRAGVPICANMRGSNAGYFLAASPDELQHYCNVLYKRGGELFKTRRALLAVLDHLKELKETEAQHD